MSGKLWNSFRNDFEWFEFQFFIWFLEQFSPPELPDTFDDRIYIETVLHAIYECLRVCTILIQPAVPTVSYKILNRLGIPLESRYLDDAKLGFEMC